jgi:hypothetical protein
MRLLHKSFESGSSAFGTMDNAVGLAAKLNFQFNPNQLTRSVTARTDTQLWINQSPTQLLQPAIGDMSFGWTMLFNREAEVSRNTLLSGVSNTRELDNPELDSMLNPKPGERFNPEMVAQRLGVLADIAILDRITGQSITKEAVDYARKRHDLISEAGLDEEEDPEDSTNFVLEAAERAGISEEDLLSANAHNSAFLIPNPIRAVFSENFMVDGYVNSVTVSFQKFSPEMIPTVAVVDISMHAIYQGFARKKTIFSDLLKMQASERYPPPDEGGDALHNDRVPPDNTAASALKEFADSKGAVLTGFDHSPPKDRTGRKDTIPEHPETKLSKHKEVSVGRFKMVGGISFAPVSYFSPDPNQVFNETLGTHLRRNLKRDTNYVSRLSGETHVGLSLRARLKAPSSGTITNRAALNALIGGDEGGMKDSNGDPYNLSDAFFVGWSAEQRRELLATGLDNARLIEGRKQTLFDEFASDTQNNGFYTRSFPIIEGANGYGDQLDMFTNYYSDVRVTNDYFIFFADYKNKKWDEDKTEYNMALGFYVGDTPFPSTLSITNSSSADVTYAVEYQMRILFRTFLHYLEPTDTKDGIPYEVSDTNWLMVHPRTENTQILHEGSILGIGTSARDTTLNGTLVAGVAKGVGLDSSFPWLTDPDVNLHFDGLLDAPEGGVAYWPVRRGSVRPMWINEEEVVT